MGENRTKWPEQYIFNWATDYTVNPPQLTVGMKEYHPSAGWTRKTIGGHAYSQFEWSGGELIYRGINSNIAAADASTDWIIFKYTWTDGELTKVQSQVTSWSSRSVGW